MLRGMWDLPGSRIEPVSLALAGRLFTTDPLGKQPPPPPPLPQALKRSFSLSDFANGLLEHVKGDEGKEEGLILAWWGVGPRSAAPKAD